MTQTAGHDGSDDVVAAKMRRWDSAMEMGRLRERNPEKARELWAELVERHGDGLDADVVRDAIEPHLFPGHAPRPPLPELARHEAAHAVVGMAVGWPVRYVSIRPDERESAWGHVAFRCEEFSLDSLVRLAAPAEKTGAEEDRGRDAALERLVSAAATDAAGEVAARQVSPQKGPLETALENLREKHLRPAARDEREAEELLKRAIERARGILGANREPLDALAEELLERRELGEKDLSRVLARHPVSMVPVAERLW